MQHRRNGQTPDIAREREREREGADVVIEFRVLSPSLYTHPIYFSRLSVLTLEKLGSAAASLLKGQPQKLWKLAGLTE